MKKIAQVALLSRKPKGSASGAGGARDVSEGEVDEDHRVRYTSAAPVDLTLGDFALQMRNGEWIARDGSAAAASAVGSTTSTVAGAAASSAETQRLQQENEALRGEVNMLKFKIELLIDMVTLANLDCDKLEEQLDTIKQ